MEPQLFPQAVIAYYDAEPAAAPTHAHVPATVTEYSPAKAGRASAASPAAAGAAAISHESLAGYAQYLYVTYFFAAWGDRTWEFAAIIFLLEIFPQTLLPASLFGFAETFAGIASGARVGAYIDTHDRLTVLRTSIMGQNSVICVAGLVFFVTLQNITTLQQELKLAAVVAIIAAGMVAKVTASLNKISMHKDWVVVLAHGNPALQTVFNSNMRRVDLICSIVAPVSVGLLSYAITPALTCLCIAGWCFCSLFLELRLSRWVFDQIPLLQQMAAPGEPSSSSSKGFHPVQYFTEVYAALLAWRRHKCFGVSLPYCLLFMSMLSDHGVMISYLRTIGCSDVALAAMRGIAAVFAITSTFAVAPIAASKGLIRTGVLTLWIQIGCLTPLFLAFVYVALNGLTDPTAFIATIFVTVSCSRFGLWGFDLVETQLMQELVKPEQVGEVNGAQEMLMNTFELLSFVFTMVFSDPTTFLWPVVISYSAVLAAGLLMLVYAKGYSVIAPQPATD